MIYEFFSFYNEFDMLELKLQEHSPYVDRFIITEANKTYNQIDKPYRLESQWDRYKSWHKKITYLKFDATGLEAGWHTEHAQREWPIHQVDMETEDIMLISDLDEFLLPQGWYNITDMINDNKSLLLESECYWCHANVKHRTPQYTIAAIKKKYFVNALQHRRPQLVFADKPNPLEHITIVQGGAHLTWMGDQKMFEQKLDGSIEGHQWSKEMERNKLWENKKQNKLFNWKAKFKKSKLEIVPLEDNIIFTDSMKAFIKKQPNWLL